MAKQDEARKNAAIKAAFGAVNRQRLIDLYFTQFSPAELVSRTAWAHVYRLLLWADQTTGLAHCYESDKSQPGKNWYSRSLAFHDWVARALNVEPGKLAKEVDWLFRRAVAELAGEVTRNAQRVTATATRQRLPYEGRGFPEPGEDPELVLAVREVIGTYLVDDPSIEEWRSLVQRVRQHLALENKRKNLVGEGFEDVLAQVIRRTCGLASTAVRTRTLLHDLPGFNPAGRSGKPNKVDLAIVRPNMRTIVTAKWSLRADREKQFAAEFDEYSKAEAEGKLFEYVFVTNEFDPARLMRACEKVVSNVHMFSHVVHINTDALKATYGDRPEPSTRKVLNHIESGRLLSLEQWLHHLST